MNRIVIFNLSDLHIDLSRETEQETIFFDLLRDFELFTKEVEHRRWMPQYVVIAGDIINKGEVENYAFAKRLVDEFCNRFKIKGSHVIMAPGNHDKKHTNISNSDKYKQIKSNFSEFCNLPQTLEEKEDYEKTGNDRKNEGTLNNFLSYHKDGFEDFCQFYHTQSFQGKDYPYVSHPLLRETELKYVSGLKIFEEDKICFLTLNTEWLYADNKVIKDIPPKDINFEVGRNIISYLYNKIQEMCPDYTVITLMHRSPYEISWFEINKIDQTTKHTLGYIEHCSDIIISGHDHSVYNQMPDLVRNRIQHFRLGSSSWQHQHDSKVFPHSVSILRIDTVVENIELLRGMYEQPSNEHPSQWKFEISKQSFPLRNKYEKKYKEEYNSISIKNKITDNVFVCDIFNNKEIEEKIKQYFMYHDIPVEKESIPQISIFDISHFKIEEDLGKKILENSIMQHIVFYYKKEYQDYFEHLEKNAIIIYNKILDRYCDQILLGNIVFNFLTIEMPLKWYEDRINYGL